MPSLPDANLFRQHRADSISLRRSCVVRLLRKDPVAGHYGLLEAEGSERHHSMELPNGVMTWIC